MRRIRQQLLPMERLTREPGHHFFGYYDLQPWSGDGRFHLCHRVAFMDRMPVPSDPSELGMVRVHDGEFLPLATTHAWNFQQGSFLQWNPAKPDEEIIFNSHVGGAWKGIVKNIRTGAERILPRAIAAVDPAGKKALAINFSRLYDFRPGYGYAGLPDPNAHVAAPEEDGIFLIDLESGKEKLIFSLAKLRGVFPDAPEAATKLLVNHINFNTDGTRFVFLLRNMPMPGAAKPRTAWGTATMTADAEGGNLHTLLDFGMASHYHWKDPAHLLIWAAAGPARMQGLWLLEDRTGKVEMIDGDYFKADGHCSYSPDRRQLLYDSYPDQDAYRHLFLYDLEKRSGKTLGVFLSEAQGRLPAVDMRCDLHPRWSRDGKAISFDSMHEGHRHVYWMDLSECL
jgi:hypothetical protein